jgi:FkbM family methyltransferase
LDVGGFRGDWADRIYKKYGCTVVILEPIKRFYMRICNRFEGNKKIAVYNAALWTYSGQRPYYIDGDASGAETIGQPEMCTVCDAKSVFGRPWDLVKINIKGDEYGLLPYMIYNQCMQNVSNLQIQFHERFVHARENRNWIRDQLKNTHKCEWSYLFVWETWKLKTM